MYQKIVILMMAVLLYTGCAHMTPEDQRQWAELGIKIAAGEIGFQLERENPGMIKRMRNNKHLVNVYNALQAPTFDQAAADLLKSEFQLGLNELTKNYADQTTLDTALLDMADLIGAQVNVIPLPEGNKYQILDMSGIDIGFTKVAVNSFVAGAQEAESIRRGR